ncbi:hypothetical protein [Micromonospora sp. CP22]|uniref:hypothetical protein n=1 Tax=Micromonospora sp. CP22 TaxID=2580517 RepID=UPI0012BC2828|nr:hypothetical protein [Micromonospora sp. CP22]MTK04126.1 hypothetical protein [Micromonospora sp. CP22]
MDPSPELEAFLRLEFEFTKQPDPVAPSLRTKRRVSLLLLILAKSYGRRLTWKGLQLINWALRDPRNMDLLVRLNSGTDIPDLPILRIEPAMDRAVDLALGLGYISQTDGRVFQLTAEGSGLAAEIERTSAFAREKEQLARLKGKITQTQINRFLEWRAR